MSMKEGLDALARERAASLGMGGPEAVKRQHALGRLTARERVARLFDPDSFMELGMLARAQDRALDAATAADGLITGFGKVNDVGTAVLAEDATVLDNTDAQVAATKRARLLDLTVRTGWQLVYLADRGEGRAAAVKETLLFGGAAKQDPEPRPGTWPSLTVAAVMGNCFGAAVNVVTGADLLVMVRGASLYLEGPGQAPDNARFHAEATGIVDRVARDDEEALALLKAFMAYLPPNAELKPPRGQGSAGAGRPATGIASLVPEDVAAPYDVTPVVQGLVDRDSLFPLKPDFALSLVTGLARLNGHTIGVAASQPLHSGGALDGAAVRKALRLARLCRRFRLPLLFIQDTPGYSAASAADQRDLVTTAGELAQTVREIQAPKLVLVLRRGHVLGDFVLGGRRLGVDYVASWPLAEIATTEPVGFAAVPPPRAGGRRGPWAAADLAVVEEVLEPDETRQRIIQFLDLALLARDLPAVPLGREAEL